MMPSLDSHKKNIQALPNENCKNDIGTATKLPIGRPPLAFDPALTVASLGERVGPPRVTLSRGVTP